MAAYLQAFLTLALGKGEHYVLVSTTLFAEKKLPYPIAVIGIFHSHKLSSRTMVPGSTQPLTEMNKR